MSVRTLCLSLGIVCAGRTVMAGEAAPPRLSAVEENSVSILAEGHKVRLLPGEHAGQWTFMGVTSGHAGKLQAVFEDFSSMTGCLVVVDESGDRHEFPKSLEPTFADPKTLYRGHTFDEVKASDQDLLGREILAEPGDPSFAAVAGALAPITKMVTYSFVGTPQSPDKIGVSYGGRTANFDPATHVPAIAGIRDAGRVLSGLVGGWQPVLRFVYPEESGDWTEMLMFAPFRRDLDNPRIQPTWYRICRIEGGRLSWAKYFDSYQPFPPRTGTADAAGFYRDLLAMATSWESALATGAQIDLPDRRLADLARHSLVRAMMTRIDSFPKYGVLDRNYGGAEHDGFQDTFNVDTTAMLEWGLFDRARDYIDNYFTHFVRDDGSLLYRGPGTGQYGRMLTVVAEYATYTGDHQLLLQHRTRIDAVARLLLALRKTAQALPREDPAHGMIAGWCEADACLEKEPDRYHQPYLSNSAEAARGFAEIGAVWERIGQETGQNAFANWGAELRREAESLRSDLQVAIERSRLNVDGLACIPAIAGAKEPPHIAAQRDGADPQFRAYRTYMEMLFSGVLPRSDVETIVRYREGTRDTILGIPTAYGYNTGELVGFLSYGHAYGLLQHDFTREFLLTLYSLSAHQYTRGTWTAPETRLINPNDTAAPYAVPAQLTVPLLVRWMLAFEDPNSDTLWICKATPRDWLKDGETVAASAIPTRWGRIGILIESHLDADRIDVSLDLPASAAPRETIVRLRVPGERPIKSVLLDRRPWTGFDPVAETVSLPASASGKITLTVGYK